MIYPSTLLPLLCRRLRAFHLIWLTWFKFSTSHCCMCVFPLFLSETVRRVWNLENLNITMEFEIFNLILVVTPSQRSRCLHSTTLFKCKEFSCDIANEISDCEACGGCHLVSAIVGCFKAQQRGTFCVEKFEIFTAQLRVYQSYVYLFIYRVRKKVICNSERKYCFPFSSAKVCSLVNFWIIDSSKFAFSWVLKLKSFQLAGVWVGSVGSAATKNFPS